MELFTAESFKDRIVDSDKVKMGRPTVALQHCVEGANFGCWTILNQDPVRVKEAVSSNTENRNNRTTYYVFAKCECGNTKWVKASYLYSRKPGSCHVCRASKRKGAFKTLDPLVKYFNDYTRNIKARAKENNLEFNLSKDYLYNLYIEQEMQCVYTDVILSTELGNISLDRIIPAKGYTEGNVEFVDFLVNRMKTDMDKGSFIMKCREIYNKNLGMFR